MTESELAILLRNLSINYPIVKILKLQEVVGNDTYEKFKKHLSKRIKRYDQLLSWHKKNHDSDLKQEAAKSIGETFVFIEDILNLGTKDIFLMLQNSKAQCP